MAERPSPLNVIAGKVGVAASFAAGLVASLVALGVLTAAQGDALTPAIAQLQDTITVVGTAVAGITTTIAGVIGSFATAKAGREVVTPVSDPRAADGSVLVPSGPPPA